MFLRILSICLIVFSISACSKNKTENNTNTTAIAANAQGKPAKDAPFVKVPLGLSEDLKIPADNPMTLDKVMLGHMLYFDKRLSADGTVSCATCHSPEEGWSDKDPVSSGIKGQKGTRHAPTVINSTYMAFIS